MRSPTCPSTRSIEGPNQVRDLFPDFHEMGFKEVLMALLGRIKYPSALGVSGGDPVPPA